ncbi:MAG TPA: pyruvate, phosphate dikinase [Candidatus Aminicenantes bacterium]|nr:pyruvate, phosphate dikinase [Acidobacteriota bacterium]HNQ81222.1 pyruvate, phosphate dikinase [Candidatus Aminicenantes bacterium]HNT32525.1 pyruvate, phosphate dikinase [Candidatus Aminicenantes bacterium]HOS12274.1 pyruvate, phosphate dikinase [Candidatus Aminicenantes bacterium]HPL14728.1 pyruvate, phosphate dikinase [Candidatus Aminicenantes bacterium]
MSRKYVYFFGAGGAEGDMKMKNILGGKGANLAEMAGLGLPVPPGFTVSTEVCDLFYKNRKRIPADVRAQIDKNLKKLEKAAGQTLGDSKNPLLVSIRSGARASMPGMMDTILNLGLNEKTVAALIAKTGNPRFAYDCYRRFIQMYGDVVLGLKPVRKEDVDPFEKIIEEKKAERGLTADMDLTADDLKDLCVRFKAAILKNTGLEFPEDPREQLWGAIGAVFDSWMNDRAIAYRKMYDIPEAWGTAVNVQLMVFGNMGPDSGTGVAFTRDAATGANVFYGEYLMNAQGEDVVAGIRTPLPIVMLKKDDAKSYAQLEKFRHVLEKHYADMMDIEFTIQQGKLYMLQCRVGKRTAFAAIKIAVDMVGEKLISEKEALSRIEPDQLNQLLRPIFDPAEKTAAIKAGRLLTKGLNAGPGAASGRIVFNSVDAEAWAGRGEKVILTRIETSPEDIKGMNAAEGILTARGGMTSHAALVARQMGRVCVAGCGELEIDYAAQTVTVKGRKLREGDWISIDGTTGEVLEGRVQTKPSEVLQVLIQKSLNPKDAPVYQTFAKVMSWADKVRILKIRTNADQPDQAANAVAFGAEGIGLCRTEHMFFGEGKIEPMREMILADTIAERKAALARLLPLQRRDFAGIFEVMKGLPVTIRTIDPPLHEFLPQAEKDQRALAAEMGIPYEKIKTRVDSLHEFNPMLGFRGCRLGVVYPEITEMQARAIFEAAADTKKKGIPVEPEVMIPLVGNVKELADQEGVVRDAAEAVMKEKAVKFKYHVGTMIEIPRGALTADEIASVAEFFSFGTNDLTQTTLGVSRDDAGRFLIPYVEKGIYAKDPFEVIDQDGVGQLMRIAVEKGRAARPGIKLGICGEHGGEPSSVEFCHQIGLNYVSCSPFRVPIARLAAARAALKGAPEGKASAGVKKPASTAKKAKKTSRRR